MNYWFFESLNENDGPELFKIVNVEWEEDVSDSGKRLKMFYTARSLNEEEWTYINQEEYDKYFARHVADGNVEALIGKTFVADYRLIAVEDKTKQECYATDDDGVIGVVLHDIREATEEDFLVEEECRMKEMEGKSSTANVDDGVSIPLMNIMETISEYVNVKSYSINHDLENSTVDIHIDLNMTRKESV